MMGTAWTSGPWIESWKGWKRRKQVEIGTASLNQEETCGRGGSWLQRIQEGLPLHVLIRGSRALLRAKDESMRPWAEVRVTGVEPADRLGPFEVTLEAFRMGERLSESAIETEGFRKLSGDPAVCLRLVVNHDAEGCPLVSPTWEIEGMEVVGRPCLAEEAGDRAWKAARAVPCREIRIHRLDPHGNWSVSTEPGHRVGIPASPVEALPIRDRYTELSRQIPARPRALPFAIPPMKPGSPREDYEPFRMCIRTKTSKEECR